MTFRRPIERGGSRMLILKNIFLKKKWRHTQYQHGCVISKIIPWLSDGS